MSTKKEKQNVLEALEAGEYEVEYEPVNSIVEHKKADGTIYCVMVDLDGPRSSTDLGSITFTVETEEESHEFIYDLNCGEWDGDELCEDDNVLTALEQLDEFIDSEDYDGDLQQEIYIKANNLPEDTEFYWCEDEDCPNLDPIYIPLEYFLAMAHGASSERMKMECEMSEDDFNALCDVMKEKGLIEGDDNCDKEEDSIEIPGDEFQDELPGLYENILNQIKEEEAFQEEEVDDSFLEFVLNVPKEFIDNLEE